jgi:hypothetical protein
VARPCRHRVCRSARHWRTEAKSATADEHAELETLARQFISRFRLPNNVKLADCELFEPVVTAPTSRGAARMVARSSAPRPMPFQQYWPALVRLWQRRSVALVARALVFELVEHWALYTEWFNSVLVRDMLHSCRQVVVGRPLRIFVGDVRGDSAARQRSRASHCRCEEFFETTEQARFSLTAACTFASPLRER